jgi:prepilin-type N-terminal cleavage/methylation domain-containing protein
MTTGRPSSRQGFLLLEVVLALAIFSIAATGLVVALNRTASVAFNSQSELKITRMLDSALDETVSIPVLEENESSYTVPGTNIELTTTIELIEDLENEDGQILQEMYRIQIMARWFANGEWQERAVETWRYGRMYQP